VRACSCRLSWRRFTLASKGQQGCFNVAPAGAMGGYSPDGKGASQSNVLPRCYVVTAGGVPEVSGLQTLQACERAGRQQLAEGAAVGQFEIGGDLRQGVEHEGAQVHLVMGHTQARLVDLLIAE